MMLTISVIAICEDNPIHWMALKTRTVTVKKSFWELPQVLRQVQKQICFMRTHEFMFFVRSLDYYGHCLGPWMSCLV